LSKDAQDTSNNLKPTKYQNKSKTPQLKLHAGPVTRLVVTRDGGTLVSASADGSVAVTDVRDGGGSGGDSGGTGAGSSAAAVSARWK
jgi:WD40 repeat protein